MNKQEQTVELFGQIFPKWVDCEWCGDNLSVMFTGVAYSQPCEHCKGTEKYAKLNSEKKKNKESALLMDHALKSDKATAVWEGRGRMIRTNYKGDMISNEPYRPLENGRTDNKKTSTII